MSIFGDRLASNKPLLGLWQALANNYTAEICARAGFDWLLFDGEHAPNTAQTLLAQLQAVAAFPVEPIARPPVGDPVIIKQYLDLGFRTLLVPMVDTAEQAQRIVAATRFPPRGVRGVASATSRASGFGAHRDYLANAHDDICLFVQIESASALSQVSQIAAVPGVDGLFIGPGDLAGSLGHLGDPRHHEVQDAIDSALRSIAASGKYSGIFALDVEDANVRAAGGINLISIGTDIGLLTNAAGSLIAHVR